MTTRDYPGNDKSKAGEVREPLAVYGNRIADAVKGVVAEIDPYKIVLFGSMAAGAAKEGADMDLLVIVSQPFAGDQNRLNMLGRLYSRLAGSGVAKDILLYSQAEAEKWGGSKNHVVGRALREGRVVYERP